MVYETLSTCHCGKIKKKSLKDRWHRCDCGVIAQRDLYSALLARYVTSSIHIDMQKADEGWNRTFMVINECILNLKKNKSER
jgi:putative transposase